MASPWSPATTAASPLVGASTNFTLELDDSGDEDWNRCISQPEFQLPHGSGTAEQAGPEHAAQKESPDVDSESGGSDGQAEKENSPQQMIQEMAPMYKGGLQWANSKSEDEDEEEEEDE